MPRQILGIYFRTDGPELPRQILEAGLVVVPSGPGLANDLLRCPAYRKALRQADWVIPDSGLMILVWNVMHFADASQRLPRYSGLRLLREVLPLPAVQRGGASFWVMPNASERDRNLAWLRNNGFPHLSNEDSYLAPLYQTSKEGEVIDEELLEVLNARRPAVIFLNIGGGVQEPLGWYLRSRLAYRPTILCTGAAIAFLTGGQASIPVWADRFFLGWLLRTIGAPGKFGRRYWNAIGLVYLILCFRHRSPVEGDLDR